MLSLSRLSLPAKFSWTGTGWVGVSLREPPKGYTGWPDKIRIDPPLAVVKTKGGYRENPGRTCTLTRTGWTQIEGAI